MVQTHEVGPYAGSDFTGTVEAARPGLEGSFEFYHNLDDERRLEIASGFHSSQTHVAGTSVASSLYSLDWFFNPWRRLELTGAYYNGQNVTPLGAGYQQGYGVYGYGDHYRRVEPVHSQGGWAQVTLRVAPRLDFHIFSGQQDDRNDDLNAGRIAKNLLFGGNLYYHLALQCHPGAGDHATTYAVHWAGVRINNHYDLALGGIFSKHRVGGVYARLSRQRRLPSVCQAALQPPCLAWSFRRQQAPNEQRVTNRHRLGGEVTNSARRQAVRRNK